MKNRIIRCFAGLTGSGKTLLIAKLAGKALQEGKNVKVINTDTYKIAGRAFWENFADLFNIDIATTNDIETEINNSNHDYIFIDTNGVNNDSLIANSIVERASNSQEIDLIHVVNVTHLKKLQGNSFELFNKLNCKGFAVTNTDRVNSYNVAMSQVPLFYESNGEMIPNDLIIIGSEND